MPELDNYIQIMIESLEKKSEFLDSIIRKNNAQTECISGKEYDEIDWTDFDLLMTEKEITIDKINVMDEGFQSLYDKVKLQLNANKSEYATQIKRIQELIKKVTDQGVEITTGEERNRRLIESVMGGRKKMIRETRNSMKVANSYFQTMQNGRVGVDDYSTVDRKK